MKKTVKKRATKKKPSAGAYGGQKAKMKRLRDVMGEIKKGRR